MSNYGIYSISSILCFNAKIMEMRAGRAYFKGIEVPIHVIEVLRGYLCLGAVAGLFKKWSCMKSNPLFVLVTSTTFC